MKKIYFEAKVQYQGADEKGKLVKKVEYFILEQTGLTDTNFADAEKRIIAELRSHKNIGNVQVEGLKRTNYVEVHEDNDIYHERFKCKVDMFSTHPETGKKIVSTLYHLVQAEDSKEAIERLDLIMVDSLTSYAIPNVAQTPIVDVLFAIEEDDLL